MERGIWNTLDVGFCVACTAALVRGSFLLTTKVQSCMTRNRLLVLPSMKVLNELHRRSFPRPANPRWGSTSRWNRREQRCPWEEKPEHHPSIPWICHPKLERHVMLADPKGSDLLCHRARTAEGRVGAKPTGNPSVYRGCRPDCGRLPRDGIEPHRRQWRIGCSGRTKQCVTCVAFHVGRRRSRR